MDFLVTWSPEAVEDLESIGEYIARDSGAYARAVITKILNVSKNLGQFPGGGRVVPEIDDHRVRERFIYSYRLIYRIKKSGVLIVAVIHGKRLLENVPERLGNSSRPNKDSGS